MDVDSTDATDSSTADNDLRDEGTPRSSPDLSAGVQLLSSARRVAARPQP